MANLWRQIDMADTTAVETKTCRECGETKPRYEFHVDRQKRDGLRGNCAKCAVAYQVARRGGYSERHRKHGRKVMGPGVITLAKSCTDCGHLRQASDFQRSRNASDGLVNKCKFCVWRRWAVRSAEAKAITRRAILRRLYGLTPETFDALLISQAGRCAICQEPMMDELAIDHDHQTGAVRGLLDGFCNRGLGMFRDDPQRLRAAAKYLEEADHSFSRPINSGPPPVQPIVDHCI